MERKDNSLVGSGLIEQFNQNKNLGLTVQINPEFASAVTQRAQPYKALPYKMRPALEAVGDYVRTTMIPRVFGKEGPGWRPLSMRTRMERISKGFSPSHPILVRTGDLFKELTEKSHPKHIEIVKTGKDARIEIGGSSEKFTRNQAGDTQFNIPARPMLPGTGWIPVEREDVVQIRQIIRDQLFQIIQGSINPNVSN